MATKRKPDPEKARARRTLQARLTIAIDQAKHAWDRWGKAEEQIATLIGDNGRLQKLLRSANAATAQAQRERDELWKQLDQILGGSDGPTT